ncbi:hypothetical protein ACHAWO_013837 [Cyclotella atomus]|uniref:Uncharacterized protein n=1 Tax=Cyclotella atomus TaxID=382360 RepID=A0ABD3QIG9_9STRA
MTFETDLYSQIHQAASLFERAQRQFNSPHNNSNNNNNHQDMINDATASLDIYQSCLASIKRAKRTKTNTVYKEKEVTKKCINLELRMATILRFLAISVLSNTNNDEGRIANIKSAIGYHDDAVSLLVGVFDDGKEENKSDVDKYSKADEMEDEDDDSSILFTLQIPQQTGTTILQFTIPTENQRVRAIATSLNSLASLHALFNDDRSAMDAYREALEILRAATEEEEEECKSETKSGIELDLAETLMNVGTFHLRRDELDAALNAYSTVYALHLNGSKESSTSSSSSSALAALNNLGIVHERRGELVKALECYMQVKSRRVDMLGVEDVAVADAWMNIGNCMQRQLQWEEAGGAYVNAIEIYQKYSREESSWQESVKLSRALSGALRNNGTRFSKQRKIADAIEQFVEGVMVEDEMIQTLFSTSQGENGIKDAIYQSKLSMAQMLGILGCLYLEHLPLEAQSFCKSKGAFHKAIQIYFELGCAPDHPSVVWAGSNLESASRLEEQSKQQQVHPPPPPPPTPPPKKQRNPLSPSSVEKPELVTRGISETTKFVNDLETPDNQNQGDKAEGDSVFLGVEDYQSSTDELDEILSQRVETITQSAKNISLLDVKNASHESPFDEEADFVTGRDTGPTNAQKSNHEEIPDEVNFGAMNSPLSAKNRNISYTSFTETPDRNEGFGREEELRDELNKSYEHFGEESEEVARAHIALAEAFWQRGDRASATEHYTIAHSIFDYKLGDNESCAAILKALGDLNKEDEKYDAANELYNEAMEIETSVYGHCLPSTLNAAGVVCLLEEDFRAAMEFHRRALQLQQKSLEEGNKYEMYETLVLIGNVYYSERNNLSNIRSKGVDYKEFIELGFLGWIAHAHDMRGEYIKACQFYEESLQINISEKRKESKKETALTLNRLGSLNRELGRYDEAIEYHQRAMLLQQSTSNSAKAMTAETCVLMGMVKAKMGQYQKALNLYEDSLLVLKASLGDKHLSVAKTMTQIGGVHLELSNYDKAMSILSEAEEYQVATVGEHHRDTFETQTLLGRVLSAIGKFDQALVKLHNVVENQTKMFGENHPSIAETNQFIGECFLDQNMVEEAREMFVHCYNMRKRFFSLDMLAIAESMVDVIRARSGRPERSLAIYRNAMEIYNDYLPDNHPLLGHLLVYEGDIHVELLDFASAVDRYHKANNIFLKTFGEGHLVVADILVNIGQVLLRKCDYDGAKEQFCTALEIYNTKLPEGHPKIAAAAQHLDRLDQEEALCV